MALIRGMRAPDFIIAGGMKCGTTTLHHILGSHPKIFIPGPEVFCFDMDEWLEHPRLFHFDGREWFHQVYDPASEDQWRWYASFFDAAKPGQVIGEDSTTYLSSTRAATRVAQALPDAKIILLLRDPASRAYSQYWHLVRVGWVSERLEELLIRHPDRILRRSCYLPQVQRFVDALPRERMMILSFEEFLADMQGTVNRITAFLGLEQPRDVAQIGTHSNRGAAPVLLGPHLFFNRVLHDVPPARYSKHFARHSPAPDGPLLALKKLTDKVRRRLNPLRREIPKMDHATRHALDTYLSKVNEGLDDLVGRPISRDWYKTLGPRPERVSTERGSQPCQPPALS